MEALNEISVDLAEFKSACGWVSKSRKDLAQETFLVFEDDGFTVVTPQAITKVKSSGRWVTPVAIPAQYFKAWVNGLPKTQEITLLYFNDWLQVGKLRVRARPVAMLARLFSDGSTKPA
ncbi:MAG: hypothetical protein JWN07_1250 [Hyphomicrobiales bacterium]|nr:hypothetical protein [Hyphomicrobiales bacterium]